MIRNSLATQFPLFEKQELVACIQKVKCMLTSNQKPGHQACHENGLFNKLGHLTHE